MGKARKLAVGAIVAATAGYVAGLLTAPKSGKETRADIKRAASKARTSAEKQLKALHSELSKLIEQGKTKVSGLKSQARQDINKVLKSAETTRQKTREVLSALHDGDADDKELKKAVKDVNKAVAHLKRYFKNAS